MEQVNLTIDELASIIGAKEIELYHTRKQLMQTRAVLEQVTSGKPQEKGDGTGGTADVPATTESA